MADLNSSKTFDSLHEATEAYNELATQAAKDRDESGQLLAEADKAVTAAETKTGEVEAKLTAALDANEAHEAKIADLEEAAKNQESDEWRKAAQIAADSATDPAEDIDLEASSENELTREEFDKLDLKSRMQFFKDGGKLAA